jgi:hypothetical protein
MIQIEKNLQELLRLKNLTVCSNTPQNFMRVNNDPNWSSWLSSYLSENYENKNAVDIAV